MCTLCAYLPYTNPLGVAQLRSDVYGPSPSGGEDYAKCIGRDKNAPSCFDLQETRNIFDRMMDSDVWPISVRSGWSDDDLSNATFRFYPAACLFLEGTPVLRPFCKNGNRKRNDSWISVVLPDTSSQAPPVRYILNMYGYS